VLNRAMALTTSPSARSVPGTIAAHEVNWSEDHDSRAGVSAGHVASRHRPVADVAGLGDEHGARAERGIGDAGSGVRAEVVEESHPRVHL